MGFKIIKYAFGSVVEPRLLPINNIVNRVEMQNSSEPMNRLTD